MIAKGNQRARAQELATHLLNAHDNEHVEIADIRHAIANDLHGAFQEWEAIASGTKCQKFLYSLSINPNPTDGRLTRDQYMDFIARAEAKQGLMDQPRVIVFHVKHGREHCHVVWSRIDSEKMKAILMSHDRYKMRAVVQEFSREHGLTLPRGLKDNKTRNQFNEKAKVLTLGEKQQEERTGLTKQERVRDITAIWNQTQTAKDFVQALKAKDYTLTNGKRGYVVVDRLGEIHSLPRQIEGVKSKEIKARLAKDCPLEKLPAAEKIQKQIRDATKTKIDKQISVEFRQQAATQWGTLKHKQKQRRDRLDAKRQSMLDRHRTARADLAAAQKKDRAALVKKFHQEKPAGMKKLLSKITGSEKARKKEFTQKARFLKKRHARAGKAFKARHAREGQDMTRRFRALASVERKESRALTTALKRTQFQSLTQAYQKAQGIVQETEQAATPKPLTPEFTRAAKDAPKQKERSRLSPSQQEKVEGIKKAAKETTTPAAPETIKEQDSLSEAFRRLEKQKEKRAREKNRNHDPGRGMGR